MKDRAEFVTYAGRLYPAVTLIWRGGYLIVTAVGIRNAPRRDDWR